MLSVLMPKDYQMVHVIIDCMLNKSKTLKNQDITCRRCIKQRDKEPLLYILMVFFNNKVFPLSLV